MRFYQDDYFDMTPYLGGDSYSTELRNFMNKTTIGNESNTKVKLWMDNSYTNISKIKTFLTLPNNDTMNVNTSAGDVRFTADDEKFVLIVANVTDENSSSIFDKGANAILVPSAVFFTSKFFNLTNGTAQADATTNLSSFMAGNTTWLQPNATGSPSCLLFTIAIIQNSTAMEQLMTYLLQNATGNKTSWYANVTDYLYLCNLPVALTRIVPFAGCENFSVWQGTGQDPPDESYWDTFQDGCVKLATAFVDASATCWEYVESGQFFEDLCYVYSGEWMMGAAKAVGEKLSEIKEVVVEALNFVKNWLIEKVKALVDTLVTPLKASVFNSDVLEGLYGNLQYSLFATALYIDGSPASSDYTNETHNDPEMNQTGTFKWILDSLTSGAFFYMATGLVIALQVVRALILAYTAGGAGILGSSLFAMLPGLIVGSLFGFLITGSITVLLYGFFSTFLYPVLPSDDLFWGEGVGLAVLPFITMLLSWAKHGFTTESLLGQTDVPGLILTIVGLVLQVLPEYIDLGYSGNLTCAIIGLALAVIGTYLTITTKDPLLDDPLTNSLWYTEEGLGIVATVYSLISFGQAVTADK